LEQGSQLVAINFGMF